MISINLITNSDEIMDSNKNIVEIVEYIKKHPELNKRYLGHGKNIYRYGVAIAKINGETKIILRRLWDKIEILENGENKKRVIKLPEEMETINFNWTFV